MDAIIFDLDGTLADCTHRVHHVTGGRKDWSAFFDGIGDDSPVDPVRRLLLLAHGADLRVVLCSGRPEKCREPTEAWLARHDIPFHALYMRPDDDTRPDHVVKGQLLDGIFADGYAPFLVIDDRQSVVNMWRERGLTCLQCAPSEAETSGTPGMLTVMVGPSGAGKTTWLASDAAKALGIHPSHVVASDQVRADICGDFLDQTRNDEVFAAVHALVKVRLRHGLPTVVDATNLRRKDRLAVTMLAAPSAPVRYVVVNRPMDDKRRDAGWRAALPFDLLTKHEQTFGSQIKDILSGDGLANVSVIDLRVAA